VILGCDSLAGAQELNRVGAARGERLQISLGWATSCRSSPTTLVQSSIALTRSII
jgi:hypothetical protein